MGLATFGDWWVMYSHTFTIWLGGPTVILHNSVCELKNIFYSSHVFTIAISVLCNSVASAYLV
jgi:hypothetical protein